MNILALVTCLLISYLLGSIPWGYLLVRCFKRIDIRKYGSGNIGFTNVLRVAGKPTAALTLILDSGKGWLAVACLAPWLHGWGRGLNPEIFQIGAFITVVGGHIFPFFLHFKGGKGIATGAGALLALSPAVFGITLGFWLLLVILFRYVSLGSILAVALLPLLMWFFQKQLSLIIFTLILAILIIIRHRDNIKRLLSGKERKIGEKIALSDETRMKPPANSGVPPPVGKSR